jgi:hypothetical protein
MVDLGLLVIAHNLRPERPHCERVSGTSLGHSEFLNQPFSYLSQNHSHVWVTISISSQCSELIHSIEQKIQNGTLTLGHKVMHNFGIHPEAYWYWIGIGTLAAYMILFNTLYTLTLTYLDRKHALPSLCQVLAKQ